jgi:hypothetical protein
LGRTTNKTLERKQYIAVEEVLDEQERKLAGKVTTVFTGGRTYYAVVGWMEASRS